MKSLLLLLFMSFILTGASEDPVSKYINKYRELAISEMKRSGVPASITLAQGILESDAGRSPLAVKGNNHFGIKCHRSWKGKTMSHDDDALGECFRVYPNVAESFKNHSDFLTNSERYKPLFELDPKDYKGWANGLKKAGYATDPKYPEKLISLIERYELYRYDDNTAHRKVEPKVKEETTVKEEPKVQKHTVEVKRAVRKRRSKVEERPIGEDKPIEGEKPIGEEGDVVYSPYRILKSYKERVNVSFTKSIYEQNGVPFIYSGAGDSYSSLASSNGLFLKELLKFNDLTEETPLEPGTMVYLARKKTQGSKNVFKYVVDSDTETLWDVSQRFGIRLKSLEKLNPLLKYTDLRQGDTVYLKKP